MGRDNGGSTVTSSTSTHIREASTHSAPVLLLGEPGTGKETVARYIHRQSGRRGPFVPVRARSAVGEIFDPPRGPPAGASRGPRGALALASGGTLFVDEVTSLSPDHQTRLHRYLLGGEGPGEEFASTTRILCATTRDLAELVQRGEFSGDLCEQLSSRCVRLRPVRERPDELPALLEIFRRGCLSNELTRLYPQSRWPRFSPIALKSAARQPWKGNLRELSTAVLRSMFMATPRLMVGASALCIRSPERAQIMLESGLLRVLETSNRAEAERFLDLAEWEFEEHKKQLEPGHAERPGRPRQPVYPSLASPGTSAAPAVACLLRLDLLGKKQRWPLLHAAGQWHQFFPAVPVEITLDEQARQG